MGREPVDRNLSFSERGSSFSLKIQAIRPSKVFGPRRKVVLRGADYAWTPKSWSFDKLCLTATNQVFHLRRDLSLLARPNTRIYFPEKFLFLYATVGHLPDVVQLYRAHHRHQKQCRYRTMHSHPCHAMLTLPQCNAIVPLHFMSCHMYEDHYMDTLYPTLHHVPWTLTSNAHRSPYIHKCQYSCNTKIYYIRVKTSNKHASTPFLPLLR